MEELDPANKMLGKLLLHNKLITKNQWIRVIEGSQGKSDCTLPEEILKRLLVKESHMAKVVAAVEKKGLIFSPLNEETIDSA